MKARIRAPYKKHKPGYKISITYRLNTSVKGKLSDDGQMTFPLYVDVVARRKNTRFRSYFHYFVAPGNFDEFMNNPLIGKLLLVEQEFIRECVQAAEAGNNCQRAAEWLTNYKQIQEAKMGSIVSKIYDEEYLHGSWENYLAFSEEQARKWMHIERPASLQTKPEAVPAVKIEKPPQGIMPLHLWIAQRWRDVDATIKRYEGSQWAGNPNWIQERDFLDQLLEKAIRAYKNEEPIQF